MTHRKLIIKSVEPFTLKGKELELNEALIQDDISELADEILDILEKSLFRDLMIEILAAANERYKERYNDEIS